VGEPPFNWEWPSLGEHEFTSWTSMNVKFRSERPDLEMELLRGPQTTFGNDFDLMNSLQSNQFNSYSTFSDFSNPNLLEATGGSQVSSTTPAVTNVSVKFGINAQEAIQQPFSVLSSSGVSLKPEFTRRECPHCPALFYSKAQFRCVPIPVLLLY